MRPSKSIRHQQSANARWRKADQERADGIPDRPPIVEHRQPIPLALARLGWRDVTLEPRAGYVSWRCRDDKTGEVLACKAFGQMLRWIAGRVPRMLGARNLD
jgi:hypothetical protein